VYHRVLTWFAVVSIGSVAFAGENQNPPKPDWMPPFEVDAETLEVLRKINSVGAYQLPDLGLRTDQNYAHTPSDVQPFGYVAPFKQHFLLQLEYAGPGRAKPEPDHVDTVKIGFIGPIMSTVSVATGGKSHEETLGIKMLQGAKLAVEQANAKGGYLRRQVPFELVVTNDNGLWGASGNEIIKLAYKQKVWAILGTIDGANTHIAIRVALKAELVMMASGDTDPTFIETNIPWVVRCIGDDRQQGYLLVDYLYRKLDLKRVGIIRASNRYGRFGVREIQDDSRRLERPIILEMAYPLGVNDFGLQLDRLKGENLDAIVHWGDAADGARILNQMRAKGMQQPYFCCDRCVCDEFVEIAGKNAEGVVCTFPWDPTRKDPKLEAFRAAFRQRFGEEAETYAAHAYDGMNMLIWAIQLAGLNRAKIRDVLAYRTRPWEGVTGEIPLSACLDDLGDVFLVRRENGRWNYYSRQDLGMPRGPVQPRDRTIQTPVTDAAGKPFFDARAQQTEYAGPERELPPPAAVDEVLIGYFGPSDPADPRGGDMWRAAEMAVQEANAGGGYHGKPFRLVPVWSGNPWGTGVSQLARTVYRDRVWAIIGGIDGPSTHLAEQVVAKARLTLLSPASSDKTVNLANVPWMFSCLPGDHLQAPLLAAEIEGRVGKGPFFIVSTDDHDAHLFADELGKSLARRRMAPRFQIQCKRATRDPATGETPVPPALTAQIMAANVDAVVLVAAADDSARLLTALRSGGFGGLVFGGPAMGRRAFLQEAGAAAEGVLFPLLYRPGEQSREFAHTFERQSGWLPDYAAAHTYDAVRLLLGAIGQSGLNRARIRDALEQLSPWEGTTGSVRWDRLGANTRAVTLGTIRDGCVTSAAEVQHAAIASGATAPLSR